MKQPVRVSNAGSAHIIAAWVFLVGAIISGIVGVYRMMSPGAADGIAGASAAALAQQSAGCMCLGVLLGIIAAVLALLGIHRHMVAFDVVPSFQGAHGSGDGDT